MSNISSLVASIDERLAQLTSEIEALMRGRAALVGPATSRRPNEPTARPGRRRRRPSSHDDGGQQPVSATTMTGPRVARAAAKPKASEARQRRRPVTGMQLTREGLEQLLGAEEKNFSARTIAERMGAGYGATLSLLRDLESSGRVRREGSRQSTVWLLITDEERVATRAAELAQLATAPPADRPRARRRKQPSDEKRAAGTGTPTRQRPRSVKPAEARSRKA